MPTLLITRPEGRAAAEMQACAAAGWRAVPFSPIRIEADAAALQQLPARFRAADAVFWVSPSAVAAAAPLLDFSDGLPVQIAVGQGSAKALAQYCPQPVYAPETGNDSEAVLRLDVWQNLAHSAKILIVRGRGGRDFLAQSLRRQGFAVELAEVYFRRPQALDWALFAQEKPQAAYVTSSAIASALFAQVPLELAQSLETLLYFTHHERIAATLRAAGADNVRLVAQLDMHTLQRETE
ncbi:uroporphyrinogen-III synthase [Uruburuella testudinis]|uniref:Uroporphyrinogen-III synthase n=1 Tax=Uruburuella testudinis TaxID=1282863 RepID=A0ABY4DWU3_9NEIS|nr:uroporphyrinogen-III synthase [Uruburuella testudinis]UOO81156.1 uroporphyrinogen-III synthase [Uruburuella testudinis]